jgi:hypothetical protein
LHIVAGIAAMGLAAALGIVMGLNNTAVFTSSCVVFVAVSLWVQSRVARLQGLPQPLPDGVALERTVDLTAERTTERAAERSAEQLPSGEGNAA